MADFLVRGISDGDLQQLGAWADEAGEPRNAYVLRLLQAYVAQEQDRREQAALAAEPHIIGYRPIKLYRDVTCAETGRVIPGGTEAWETWWSDDRDGAIVSAEWVAANV